MSQKFEFSGFLSTFTVPTTAIVSDNRLVGVSFASFLDTSLFPSALNTSETQLGSTVMSAKVTGNLTGKVTGTFNYITNYNESLSAKNTTDITPTCVFYVEPTNGGPGSWSTTGCKTKVLNKSHVRCECNHLTSFAVLVSDKQHSPADTWALNAITHVGTTISLLCIVITIVTLLMVDVLRKQLRYRVR